MQINKIFLNISIENNCKFYILNSDYKYINIESFLKSLSDSIIKDYNNKEIDFDYYENFFNENNISFDEEEGIYKKIFNNYNEFNDTHITHTKDYIRITSEDILHNLSNDENDLEVITKFYKTITIKEPKGNCIDRFIEKGFNTKLESLIKYTNNIRERRDKRTDILEYHNTSCFEYDYNQLIKIRGILEKMLSMTNKQIESLSDPYTKL